MSTPATSFRLFYPDSNTVTALALFGPDGAALPCQEARLMTDLTFPTVREHGLAWLWNESPTFRKFRGLEWMREPCNSCSEKETDFGGCRCQAYLLTGDACNTDPACGKSPHHGLVTDAVARAANPARTLKPLVMPRDSARGRRRRPRRRWRAGR